MLPLKHQVVPFILAQEDVFDKVLWMSIFLSAKSICSIHLEFQAFFFTSGKMRNANLTLIFMAEIYYTYINICIA